MNTLKYLIPLITSGVLMSCDSSTTAVAPEPKTPALSTTDTPAAATFTLNLSFTPTKAFSFSWEAMSGATSYKLKEAVSNGSPYNLIKETTATSFDHVVPLHARLNAKYILESCNAADECTTSKVVFTSDKIAQMTSSIGYFKASSTGQNDQFGNSVSLSADGNTLAVGAPNEQSNSKVIDAGEDNDDASLAGAVYVFIRNNNASVEWSQQAYLKASNTDRFDQFGSSVSLSADGNTLAVGAHGEGSGAGAAYVFIRTVAESSAEWSQQAYLKASNTQASDFFGFSVSLSADGNILAVGAVGEDSDEEGEVSGNNGLSNSAESAGAVYVFVRTVVESSAEWSQQAYLKASNTGEGDQFGRSVSISGDGDTLAVGAIDEDSVATGINHAETEDDERKASSGAVYVFIRTVVESSAVWNQQAYLKASNTDGLDRFGRSVSISKDGNTLAVGADGEQSIATGINLLQGDNLADGAGAVYVFVRNASKVWAQQAYLKASNTGEGDNFGRSVSLSADGNTLAAGAYLEDSDATGINVNGPQGNGVKNSGAVYTFTRSGITWSQQAHLKASNTGENDRFGDSVALSANGGTLAVGAYGERSNATGINADKDNNDATDSGAVYVY